MTWVSFSRGRQIFRGGRTGRARWLTTGRYGCVQTLNVLRDRLPRDANSTGSDRDLCTHRAKFVRRLRMFGRFIIQYSSINQSLVSSLLRRFSTEGGGDLILTWEGGGVFRPDQPGVNLG